MPPALADGHREIKEDNLRLATIREKTPWVFFDYANLFCASGRETFRKKGYSGWLEAGGTFYPRLRTYQKGRYTVASFRVFNGARLNPRVSLGLETGVDLETQVPVDAKVRVNILKKRITPFADFSCGYSFVFIDLNTHGFNYCPALGFKVWGKDGMAAFTLRAGYTGLTYVIPAGFDNWYGLYQPRRTVYRNGLNIMLGVEY